MKKLTGNELRDTIKTIMIKRDSKTERYMFHTSYLLSDVADRKEVNEIESELKK